MFKRRPLLPEGLRFHHRLQAQTRLSQNELVAKVTEAAKAIGIDGQIATIPASSGWDFCEVYIREVKLEALEVAVKQPTRDLGYINNGKFFYSRDAFSSERALQFVAELDQRGIVAMPDSHVRTMHYSDHEIQRGLTTKTDPRYF